MPGLIGFLKNLDQAKAGALLQKMAQQLEPEERFKHNFYQEDGFAFGRVSLGILNPQPQPAWNADHTIAVIMEGELYQKPELHQLLRDKNISPAVQGDAALALQLYEALGEDFAIKLNGAFAIAIWDKSRQRLLLISDRLGLQPLYYAIHNHEFVFGSGVRAILADPSIPRTVDPTAIQEFLTHDHILGQRTLLQHVKLLPQAHILTFEAGEMKMRPYYSFRYAEFYPYKSEDEYIEEFLFQTHRAVQRQDHDDLPMGLLLSGGLDSRMLLAILSEKNKQRPLNTFTWSIPGSDDARRADELARATKSNHDFLELKPDWLLQLGEKAVRITDGMGNLVNTHALATLEAESQKVQILYKGFMGDAMMGFALRPRFWADYEGDTLFEQHLEAYRDYDVLTFDFPAHPAVFTDEFRKQVGDSHMQDFKSGMLASRSTQMADQRCYFDLTQRVQRMTINGVLVVRDRVEARLPFCDNDLVEFTLSVPPWLRYERVLMVRAFIKAYEHLARIPLASTGLPMMFCGRELLLQNWHFIQWHLRKAGLGWLAGPARKPYKDYNLWFRTVLRKWVEDTLLNPHALERGYFRPETVRRIVTEHMNGKNHAVRLGAWMSIELWHRQFLD